jgi:hypothetical protein
MSIRASIPGHLIGTKRQLANESPRSGGHTAAPRCIWQPSMSRSLIPTGRLEHILPEGGRSEPGKGILKELSDWLLTWAADLKGFSASNLWRMKQYHQNYVETR